MKAVLAMLLALVFAAELSAQLTYDRIRQAVREPASWLTYHGTYDAQRFSALDEINRANVQQLRPVWMYQVSGTPSLRDHTAGLRRCDVPHRSAERCRRAGRQDRTTAVAPIGGVSLTISRACCGDVNRGVAALGDQIFVATIDAHLVALDCGPGACGGTLRSPTTRRAIR